MSMNNAVFNLGKGVRSIADDVSLNTEVPDYEEVEFLQEELDHEQLAEISTYKSILHESVVSKKMLKQISAHVNSLKLDMQEGTLIRVENSCNPVVRLDLYAISEDSDEAPDTVNDLNDK